MRVCRFFPSRSCSIRYAPTAGAARKRRSWNGASGCHTLYEQTAIRNKPRIVEFLLCKTRQLAVQCCLSKSRSDDPWNRDEVVGWPHLTQGHNTRRSMFALDRAARETKSEYASGDMRPSQCDSGGACPSRRGTPRIRYFSSGFTLIEALLSIVLVSIAGVALMSGIASSIDTTDAAVQEAVALGLAQQLMDEIAICRYVEPGGDPYSPVLGPESGETAGNRTLFDDIDDYNGLVDEPPTTLDGTTLGVDDAEGGTRDPNFQVPSGQLDRWRREVSVYYVDSASPDVPLPAGTTSDFRAVEVRVYVVMPGGVTRQIVSLKRVFAYVPPPS